MTNQELLDLARSLFDKREVTEDVCVAGAGSALVTEAGNIYTGVSIRADCGVGFCAECNAMGAMVTNEEFVVKKIATSGRERYFPPCGRCRELMYQLSPKNLDTEIILGLEESVTLKEIFPHRWQEVEREHD